MTALSRRRFIAISAAAAGNACLPPPAIAASVHQWTGTALGAAASIRLTGLDQSTANRMIARCQAEMVRMEAIFSLYRRDSALMRLNADGVLPAPPLDLVALLSDVATLHEATQGVFDPTIQPAWAALAETAGRAEPNSNLLNRIGFDHVARSGDEIRFSRPGMAMTLNGIAQGYATDRVADLLRTEGLSNVLVEVGEIRALDGRPDGAPWSVGIADASEPKTIVERVPLIDRAIATSAPLGTTFDAARRTGHIIDPESGRPGGNWRQVSVIAPTATLADGLSTAFCLMTEDRISRAMAGFSGLDVRLEGLGGTAKWLQG